jgi:hypothetical protein
MSVSDWLSRRHHQCLVFDGFCGAFIRIYSDRHFSVDRSVSSPDNFLWSGIVGDIASFLLGARDPAGICPQTDGRNNLQANKEGRLLLLWTANSAHRGA